MPRGSRRPLALSLALLIVASLTPTASGASGAGSLEGLLQGVVIDLAGGQRFVVEDKATIVWSTLRVPKSQAATIEVYGVLYIVNTRLEVNGTLVIHAKPGSQVWLVDSYQDGLGTIALVSENASVEARNLTSRALAVSGEVYIEGSTVGTVVVDPLFDGRGTPQIVGSTLETLVSVLSPFVLSQVEAGRVEASAVYVDREVAIAGSRIEELVLYGSKALIAWSTIDVLQAAYTWLEAFATTLGDTSLVDGSYYLLESDVTGNLTLTGGVLALSDTTTPPGVPVQAKAGATGIPRILVYQLVAQSHTPLVESTSGLDLVVASSRIEAPLLARAEGRVCAAIIDTSLEVQGPIIDSPQAVVLLAASRANFTGTLTEPGTLLYTYYSQIHAHNAQGLGEGLVRAAISTFTGTLSTPPQPGHFEAGWLISVLVDDEAGEWLPPAPWGNYYDTTIPGVSDSGAWPDSHPLPKPHYHYTVASVDAVRQLIPVPSDPLSPTCLDRPSGLLLALGEHRIIWYSRARIFPAATLADGPWGTLYAARAAGVEATFSFNATGGVQVSYTVEPFPGPVEDFILETIGQPGTPAMAFTPPDTGLLPVTIAVYGLQVHALPGRGPHVLYTPLNHPGPVLIGTPGLPTSLFPLQVQPALAFYKPLPAPT